MYSIESIEKLHKELTENGYTVTYCDGYKEYFPIEDLTKITYDFAEETFYVINKYNIVEEELPMDGYTIDWKEGNHE